MQTNLNELSEAIFNTNQKKGFYDEINTTIRLLEYKPLILEAYKHTVEDEVAEHKTSIVVKTLNFR